MNYLKEILAFYDMQEINRLSTGQIALWHALMCVNNKCAWNEWFTVAISTLELKTDLSRQGVYKARNTLKQKGYIDFKENGNGKASSYKINTLSYFAQDTSQVIAQVIAQVASQDTAQVIAPINKLNVNETKRNNNPQTPKGGDGVKNRVVFISL